MASEKTVGFMPDVLGSRFHLDFAKLMAFPRQEREIALAAEKLARCEETMSVLSRQLGALRPHSDANGS